jgi:hypothetical protein
MSHPPGRRGSGRQGGGGVGPTRTGGRVRGGGGGGSSGGNGGGKKGICDFAAITAAPAVFGVLVRMALVEWQIRQVTR